MKRRAFDRAQHQFHLTGRSFSSGLGTGSSSGNRSGSGSFTGGTMSGGIGGTVGGLPGTGSIGMALPPLGGTTDRGKDGSASASNPA
jgi:hypothetical protein